MLLDIIVPQYKETEQEIKYLLESIDSQVGVNKADFKVTIVNDHSDKILSLDFLRQFTLNINYLKLDRNVGPGMARQVGLDNTEAPWVMFCDADDILYKSDVLFTILEVLKRQLGTDPTWGFLQTNFYEENMMQGYQLLEHKGFNMIFMHGKIFNRSYLNKYGIRFSPTLRTFEDTYFCKTCSLASDISSSKTLDLFTYVWKRADGSISSTWNHDGKSYMYWRIDDYIGCNEGTLDFFRTAPQYKDKPVPRMAELVLHTILYTYCVLNSGDYFNDNSEDAKERKHKLIAMTKRVIENNKNIILTQITKELKEKLIKECIEQSKTSGRPIVAEAPTFNEYLATVIKTTKTIQKALAVDMPVKEEPKPEFTEAAK